MKNPQVKIIEKEYRFLISRDKLEVQPPKKVGKFELVQTGTIDLKDSLFERRGAPLKDENIGIRIRDIANGTIEFTYKKFLGREGEIAKYDETTTSISREMLDNFLNNHFSNSNLEIIDKLSEKGELYFYLTISNYRKVYIYRSEHSVAELVIEDIQYSNSEKSVQDAAMEIELKYGDDAKDDIDLFVKEIKILYECIDQNEGKNTRALKLLGMNLE